MKNIIFISALIFSFNILHSQQIMNRCDNSIHSFADFQEGKYYKDINNNFVPFIGTWKYISGNKTFTVELFKIENHDYGGYFLDEIQGHYRMVENEGLPSENLLYESNKFVGNSGTRFPALIYATSCDGQYIGGWITDNSRTDFKMKDGRLSIEILQGTNTAHWKITKLGENVMYPGTMPEFEIPTDIIITKQ